MNKFLINLGLLLILFNILTASDLLSNPLPDFSQDQSKIDLKIKRPWQIGLDTGVWIYNSDQLSNQSWANYYANSLTGLGWNNVTSKAVINQSMEYIGMSFKYNTGNWTNYTDQLASDGDENYGGEHYFGAGIRYYDLGEQNIVASGNYNGQTISVNDDRIGFILSEYISYEKEFHINPRHSVISEIEFGINQATISQNITIARTGYLNNYNNLSFGSPGYHVLNQLGYKFNMFRHLNFRLLAGWQMSDFKDFTVQSVNSNYSTQKNGDPIYDLAGNPLTISFSGFQGTFNANFIW